VRRRRPGRRAPAGRRRRGGRAFARGGAPEPGRRAGTGLSWTR
jgi:hypothetical protein